MAYQKGDGQIHDITNAESHRKILQEFEDIFGSFDTVSIFETAKADLEKTLGSSFQNLLLSLYGTLKSSSQQEESRTIVDPTSILGINLDDTPMKALADKIIDDILSIIDNRLASSRASLRHHIIKITEKLQIVREFTFEQIRIYDIEARNREQEALRLLRESLDDKRNTEITTAYDEYKAACDQRADRLVRSRTKWCNDEITSLHEQIEQLQTKIKTQEDELFILHIKTKRSQPRRRTSGSSNKDRKSSMSQLLPFQPSTKSTSSSPNSRRGSSQLASISAATTGTSPAGARAERRKSMQVSMTGFVGGGAQGPHAMCPNCSILASKITLLELSLRRRSMNASPRQRRPSTASLKTPKSSSSRSQDQDPYFSSASHSPMDSPRTPSRNLLEEGQRALSDNVDVDVEERSRVRESAKSGTGTLVTPLQLLQSDHPDRGRPTNGQEEDDEISDAGDQLSPTSEQIVNSHLQLHSPGSLSDTSSQDGTHDGSGGRSIQPFSSRIGGKNHTPRANSGPYNMNISSQAHNTETSGQHKRSEPQNLADSPDVGSLQPHGQGQSSYTINLSTPTDSFLDSSSAFHRSVALNGSHSSSKDRSRGHVGQDDKDEDETSQYFELFTEAVAVQRELQEVISQNEKDKEHLRHQLESLREDQNEKNLLFSLQLKERGLLIRELSNLVSSLRHELKRSKNNENSKKADSNERGNTAQRKEWPMHNLNLNEDVTDVTVPDWWPDMNRAFSPQPLAQSMSENPLPAITIASPKNAQTNQTKLFSSPSGAARGESFSAKLARGQLDRPHTTSAPSSLQNVHTSNNRNTSLDTMRNAETLRSRELYQKQGLSARHAATWSSLQPLDAKNAGNFDDNFVKNVPILEKDVRKFTHLLDQTSQKEELLGVRRQIAKILAEQELKSKSNHITRPSRILNRKVFK